MPSVRTAVTSCMRPGRIAPSRSSLRAATAAPEQRASRRIGPVRGQRGSGLHAGGRVLAAGQPAPLIRPIYARHATMSHYRIEQGVLDTWRDTKQARSGVLAFRRW
jgi:hypothetical protein